MSKSKIQALRAARTNLLRQIEGHAGECRKPWRAVGAEQVDEREEMEVALVEITDEIIALERELRDPEQDAEMRAELAAEMAITGVQDDPDLYMHTPMEEELFQERIHDEVEYGYFDPESGWVDGIYDQPNVGRCPVCKKDGVWFDDEGGFLYGDYFCGACFDDGLAWLIFLAAVCNLHAVEHRGEWSLREWSDNDISVNA